jgi:hypothetical protein
MGLVAIVETALGAARWVLDQLTRIALELGCLFSCGPLGTKNWA